MWKLSSEDLGTKGEHTKTRRHPCMQKHAAARASMQMETNWAASKAGELLLPGLLVPLPPERSPRSCHPASHLATVGLSALCSCRQPEDGKENTLIGPLFSLVPLLQFLLFGALFKIHYTHKPCSESHLQHASLKNKNK